MARVVCLQPAVHTCASFRRCRNGRSGGSLIRQSTGIDHRPAARDFFVSAALWFERLRPALAGLEFAPGSTLEASEKAIVAERPANALGGAQPVEQIRLRLAGQKIGEMRKPLL